MKSASKKSIKEIFPGIMILDNEPVRVENPFSGESIMLSPEEVAVYDYLKGCELIGDYKGLRKGIDWFIDNNAEAYMTLLD
jgi:hypothetical protein